MTSKSPNPPNRPSPIRHNATQAVGDTMLAAPYPAEPNLDAAGLIGLWEDAVAEAPPARAVILLARAWPGHDWSRTPIGAISRPPTASWLFSAGGSSAAAAAPNSTSSSSCATAAPARHRC